jgi:hypothetical protein
MLADVSLLTEIQAAATDSNTSVSDFLRRCQILAARLQHGPFKAWVAHEQNGYPGNADLPPYRRDLTGEVRAQLSGPFGSAINNAPVPLSFLGADLAAKVQNFSFYQGVGMLEALLADARQSGTYSVHNPFPVELYARMTIVEGYATMGMWKELPIHAISNILDQVKSRALAFTLEIEAENPAAGEVAGTTPPVPLARTDLIFNTAILGGNVAVGPSAQVQVVQGDVGSLMRYLESGGIEAWDRQELEAAIKADSRVKAWLGELPFRAAAAGGRIAEAAISAAVLSYFGVK